MSEPQRDPGLVRLLAAARRSLERTGGSLEATVTIVSPSDAERRIVIGITGVHRSATAQRVAIRLRDLDTYLTQAYGRPLSEMVADGSPLRDRPAERRREAAARERARELLGAGRHAGQEWYQRWLAAVGVDGTLTRVVRAGGDVTALVRVLDALPAEDEPLPVFAERVLADTKALSDVALRGLVLRAVGVWQAVDIPASAEQERALWESVGVVPDDLASQVLVLNLPADGSLVGSWLNQAAAVGLPMRLTLHQLRTAPPRLHAAEIFVTENPAVLRAASALGAAAPAMVCTEGMPSSAAHRLLAGATPAVLRWRNDFDWTGIRITAAALARYPNARPWRMAAADYRSAGGQGPPLIGTPAPTPWDAHLAEEMRRAGRAVMEERLIGVLLDDLTAAGRGGA